MPPLRIFLLLPDDAIHKSADAALAARGFERVWCRKASDALIVLSHGKFDLLICQAALPDMAGIDLLKELDAEGIDLPNILLVGPEDVHLERDSSGSMREVVPVSEGFASSLPDRAFDVVAKHQLQQANRIYIAALESARDGIMITDLQGAVVHVNRALESLTGFSRDELVGQPAQILCANEQNAELCSRMWLAVKQRASWQGELTDRRKDGATIDVSVTASPILDSHRRLTHCVVIERDITSRKVIESRLLQAQKVQSLGTLAGGVAHEFNNLLTGIMGYAGLALNHSEEPEERGDFLKEIMGLAERASELTKQMLAYARQSPMNRTFLSIANLIQASADLLERTLHQKVVIECADDAGPLRIDADANQMEQVLLNLILNSRDAISGAGAITVSAHKQDLPTTLAGFPDHVPPGAYVRLQVRDSGHGMSAEVLSRALDPFFTTKVVGKGTGLGLSVALGIIRNHHGFLTIESNIGQGTCVGIYLPRLQEPAAASSTIDSFIEPEPVSPASIVLHDDEPAVLDVVRRYLEDAGHHVLCARDEAELLHLAAGNANIHLAILDEVPVTERSGLAHRILELRPNLPLLFCPGDSPDHADFELEGMRRVLCKPFRMNELGFAVQQLLAGAQESR
jgi:two-component system, cell cycle sensor histidine kinase and response regulator CckA